MQKPERAYGMTKVEYQRRIQAFEAAQMHTDQPKNGLIARLFKGIL